MKQRDERSMTSERGITVLEVTLMLVVTITLVGALMPSLAAVVRDTKRARALSDMQKIVQAINSFKTDTGYTKFTVDGTAGGETMELLFTDGDIPNIGTHANWRNAAANVSESDKFFLNSHLVLNSFTGFSYPASLWKGAYLDAPLDPDPWGNRYAVNTEWMGPPTDDVVVFSAGPDEDVDTSDAEDGLIAGEDDIIVLVEA